MPEVQRRIGFPAMSGAGVTGYPAPADSSTCHPERSATICKADHLAESRDLLFRRLRDKTSRWWYSRVAFHRQQERRL